MTKIIRVTIARDSDPSAGFRGDGTGRQPWWDEAETISRAAADGSLIPFEIRMERLEAQIRSFERAGYRLETRAGLQAIVAKPRERRPVRDVAVAVGTLGLALLPSLIGVRRIYHRVVITVDHSGAVRLA